MTSRPQTIFRRVHTHNFTVLPNAVLNDARLSLDEKGFLCWLLSRPNDWEVIPTACQRILNIGRHSFYRITKTLCETGYCKREVIRAEDGTVVRVQFMIYDATDIATPVTPQQHAENQQLNEKELEPDADYQDAENRHAVINNDSIINIPPTPQASKPTEPPQAAEEASQGAIFPDQGKPKFSVLKLNWPPDHILSATAAERKFLRLPEVEQWAAIDRAPAYIADIRSRGWKLGDLTTYLREKRWERLASASPAAAFSTKGGTPQAFRWLEYREAMGEPTAYMRNCFATGKPWYAPSEWPPALPKRESTGPPASSLMTEADEAELARGI